MTPPTPASVTQPVPLTLIVVMTMLLSVLSHAGVYVGMYYYIYHDSHSYSYSRASYDHDLPCQCNDQCSHYGNCCPDYDKECNGDATTTGPGLSDQDLITLSEMLIAVDRNNVGGEIELNLQCNTTHGNPEVSNRLSLLFKLQAIKNYMNC